MHVESSKRGRIAPAVSAPPAHQVKYSAPQSKCVIANQGMKCSEVSAEHLVSQTDCGGVGLVLDFLTRSSRQSLFCRHCCQWTASRKADDCVGSFKSHFGSHTSFVVAQSQSASQCTDFKSVPRPTVLRPGTQASCTAQNQNELCAE